MIEINQYKLSDISEWKFDLFIAASGFESRAIFQSSILKNIPKRRFSLGFNNETKDSTRLINDEFFKENNFIQTVLDGDTTDLTQLSKILNETFESSKSNGECNIYVDYSSMTRNWYGYILYIINHYRNKLKVNVTFGYSYSKYTPAIQDDNLNKVVEPLFGYCKMSIPDKPSALIICLGNERNRAYGLQEYFDATTYLFYSDLSYNNEFSSEVEKANFDLLNSINAENVIRFPVHDLINTNYLLDSLCRGLIKYYRIILAPCGPKPFTLLSFINSLKYDTDLEVWRISPGKGMTKIDRVANGQVSLLRVSFFD